MGWAVWAAVHTAVREASKERSCCLQVAATDSRRVTKAFLPALCVPKLPLRHSTAGRIACSAAVLVGSMPGTVTKRAIAQRPPAIRVPAKTHEEHLRPLAKLR